MQTKDRIAKKSKVNTGLLILFCLIFSAFNPHNIATAQAQDKPVRKNSQSAAVSSTDTTIAFSDPLNVSLSEGTIESEPSIAVNPSSPTIFLAGMNSSTGPIAVRLSVDAGQNWHDANLPTFSEPSQGDPVAGFDANGNAFMTGISIKSHCVNDIFNNPIGIEVESGGIFVASGDINSGGAGDSSGITWADPVTVESNQPGQIIWDQIGDPNVALQDKPWLAVDTSPSSPFKNRVYLAWTTFYGDGSTIIWFTYSLGPGQPFAPKIPIAVPPSGKWVQFSNLAVGPSGDLFIAWAEGDENENVVQQKLFMRHSSNGSTFDPGPAIEVASVDVPGVLSTGEFSCGGKGRILNGAIRIDVLPSIAADPTNENRIYAVWNGASASGDSDIYMSFSDNKGSDWSSISTVNAVTVRDQFMPSVTVDKLGTVFVEWYDRKSDSSNLAFVPTVAYSRNGGLTFVQKVLNPTSYSGDYRFVYDYLQISTLPDGGAIGIWVGDGDAHISIAKYVPSSPVDVYMLVDLTDSFSDDLPNFKIQAPTIVSNLKAVNPNSRFGLGKFEDYPVLPFGDAGSGDKAYERLVDLTYDADSVLTAISGLFTRSGGDRPESQLTALYQAATGAGQDLSGLGFPGASIPSGQQANFRSGAAKIFILWTDAPFHRPGNPGAIPYPGPSFDDTVNAIKALDPPKVIGISSGGGGRVDLEAMARATNAVAPPEGVDCDNNGIIDIQPGELLVCDISSSGEGIGAAITALVEAASVPSDFNKTGPGNGVFNQPTSLTFSWEASGGATSYEYCYDTTNDNMCSSWNDVGNNTTANISGLANGTTYYWHVRAINGHGVTYSNGNSNAFWAFTIGTNPESILYMTENQGTLRRVDQSTGATTAVVNLQTNSIRGLSNRPGDSTYIYGIYVVDLVNSGLARINTVTGNTNLLPLFDEPTLGISKPQADAIAISPTAPNVAVIAGFSINSGSPGFLWKVNIETGTVLGPALPTTSWIWELAYSLDGSVLYGVNDQGQLVTVDSDTGNVALIGDPGLNTFIEGLAFRPGDGKLFAIDGDLHDRLVTLDPANGSLLDMMDSLGVVGPYGLAFIPSSQLNVSKSGNGIGNITSDPAGINCGSSCAYEFNANTDVTLTASAATGSAFTGWSGGGCSGTGTCTVTMTTSQSVTANFVQACVAINTFVSPLASGSVNINQITDGIFDPPPRCQDDNQYPYGAVIRLTAAPEAGYTFNNWFGDLSGSTSPVDITMVSDQSVTAHFRNGADTTGVFRPSNGALYLKNSNTTGFADIQINYGVGGDYPVVGDWDGNGTATIGIYRNGSFYLRNSNTIGFADLVFAFGAPGDQPVAGDWDGDGVDTIGVYRSATGTFYLRNNNSSGTPEMIFSLGIPGDVGIAGDWDGDGKDTTGVFRPSNGALYLKNANSTGIADIQINYGIAGDKPVTGDWDNDGIDTIGVYRNGSFYLRNSNTIGFADLVFALGIPGDMPIAGNWDGIP